MKNNNPYHQIIGEVVEDFAFLLLDIEGNVKSWNKSVESIKGYAAEDVIGRNFSLFYTPIERTKKLPEKLIAEAKEKGKAVHGGWHIRKNGTRFWAGITIRPLYDDEKQLSGFIEVIRDLTSQKKYEDALMQAFEKDKQRIRAEEELLQSKANLRLIIDLIPQAIYAIDADGNLIFVNKSFAAFNGALPKDLLNKNIRDVVPVQSQVDFLLEHVREVIKSGKPKMVPNLQLPDLFGFTRVFDSVNVPYRLPESGEQIVLCISVDITEQKLADEERSKMVADILQRNKDLEQFSYIVSHNLRAPVANILGIASLLEQDVTEREKTTLLNGLFSSVKSLDTVIRDLNHILQIKHQVKEQKEAVHFSGLVADIRQSIDNLLREEEVNLVTDFGRIDSILTVKSYLYSIFFNLITNSIKYRQPSKTPVIHITSRMKGKKIILYFKDNGLGIDLERKGPHIFGMYKRFHAHKEGRGMGLYMVKTQVELLGGTVTVDSEVNKGTTFTIIF